MSFLNLKSRFTPQDAHAHCDVPCGIYDPHLAQIAAHTVVRMSTLICDLEKPGPDALPGRGTDIQPQDCPHDRRQGAPRRARQAGTPHPLGRLLQARASGAVPQPPRHLLERHEGRLRSKGPPQRGRRQRPPHRHPGHRRDVLAEQGSQPGSPALPPDHRRRARLPLLTHTKSGGGLKAPAHPSLSPTYIFVRASLVGAHLA